MQFYFLPVRFIWADIASTHSQSHTHTHNARLHSSIFYYAFIDCCVSDVKQLCNARASFFGGGERISRIKHSISALSLSLSSCVSAFSVGCFVKTLDGRLRCTKSRAQLTSSIYSLLALLSHLRFIIALTPKRLHTHNIKLHLLPCKLLFHCAHVSLFTYQ